MSTLKISVVTVVMNQAGFIEQAMRSVLDQGYDNLEYIVIDGGSTDGSIDIIKKYSDRLHYWVSEPDAGMYDALNKGFAKSTGEVMMWLNSDDLLHPFALKNIAEAFSAFKDVQWITGINTAFDEQGRVIAAHDAKKFSKYDFLRGNFQWLQQESTAWRRELWNKAGAGVDGKSKLAGDFDLWLRFFFHTQLYTCEFLVGGFRFRQGQLSVAQREKYMNEAFQYLDNAKKNLSSQDRSKLARLKLINTIKTLLRYSFILDINIFRRLLDKIERNIHQYPKTIRVNRSSFTLEIR